MGFVALAAVQLSQKAITDRLTRIVVFLAGAAGMLYDALCYFPVIMVVGGVATVVWDLKLLQKLKKAVLGRGGVEARAGMDVEIHSIPVAVDSAITSAVHTSSGTKPVLDVEPEVEQPRGKLLWSWKTGLAIIAAFLASFVVIMVCRGVYSGDNRGFDLFSNLYLAGTIIFGGGPVVIPLLPEYTVNPGWVSPRDFLLGLAITQAFPGPNFNFAVYLGTLAVKRSSLPAAAGAIIGLLGIFTPGIFVVAGTVGVWSSIRKVQAIRSALRGIHAAAVGILFTAVYRLFEIGYLDANVQSGGSLSRDPWWVVVVATIFVGGMHFKLSPVLAIILGAAMGLIWCAVVRA